MFKSFLIKVTFLTSVGLTVGCIPFWIGTGVVGGYMLSNDCAVGKVKANYRDCWDASTEILKIQKAEIIEADESKGRIKAKISEIDVTIKIDSIDKNKQRLRVSARKYFLPRPLFAQSIFLKIIKEIE